MSSSLFINLGSLNIVKVCLVPHHLELRRIMMRSHPLVKPPLMTRLSWNGVGRCYLVAVTGSVWQLRDVCGCYGIYTAVLWQKEATLQNEISRKLAKCVCVHVHVCTSTSIQCNIMMSWLTSFSRMSYFCSKLGAEVDYAKSNLKPSLSQIFVICHLLPFVRVGQSTCIYVATYQ